jgi:DNA polymerase-4
MFCTLAFRDQESRVVRQPQEIERLYLDFDGFFASVEQQADKSLRGRPVGVIPYVGARDGILIACSREAKAAGIGNIMKVSDARRLCPDLVLVPQKPDLYRRAHNTLLSEIESVIPIDAVKSIDELTCCLDDAQRRDPFALAAELKTTIAENVGGFITCSIGFAANRQLAKIACKMDKPNGVTVWRPVDMAGPLFAAPLDDIPGVGGSMRTRLARAGITTTQQLYATQPKQMRKIWGNVTGERLWYALHGYDVQAPESERGMFGHARVLPPNSRTPAAAREIGRLLMVKAARRLRRAHYYASGMWLWLAVDNAAGGWSGELTFPAARDDQALQAAFIALWQAFVKALPRTRKIFRVGVTLLNLTKANSRQLDLLADDDVARQRGERICDAMDGLNLRYGRTVVSLGPWNPPKGGNVGGKISFTRIPSAEDFL